MKTREFTEPEINSMKVKRVYDCRGRWVRGGGDPDHSDSPFGWECPDADPEQCDRCGKDHLRVFVVGYSGGLLQVGSGCMKNLIFANIMQAERAARLLEKLSETEKRTKLAELLLVIRATVKEKGLSYAGAWNNKAVKISVPTKFRMGYPVAYAQVKLELPDGFRDRFNDYAKQNGAFFNYYTSARETLFYIRKEGKTIKDAVKALTMLNEYLKKYCK